jgi:hypothetical protein
VSQLAVRTQTKVRGHANAFRYVLGSLLAFGALNAFAGGYYGMSGAEDVPKEWLEGSPFDDYFIPGLVLFVVVGGSSLAATIRRLTGSYPAGNRLAQPARAGSTAQRSRRPRPT